MWHRRRIFILTNSKCTKKIVGELLEECIETIEWNKMIYNMTLSGYGNVCNFWTIYIVLFVIAFLIIIGISSEFICFHWYLKRKNTKKIID